MTPRTEATRRLGLETPIVQGPFGGGLSTARLVAEVSNKGGLGSYGAHVLAPEQIGPVAREIESLTSGPYALNLWVSDHDPGGEMVSAEAFERSADLFAQFFDELGLERPQPPELFHHRFEAQIEALLEARPPVFSFVFGIPSHKVIEACRARGIATVGAATTVAEAVALESAGIDMIVATGFEAGGHRPSFLAEPEGSLFGTFALTQLVAGQVATPVIAAGGIADGPGVRAALTLGAQAAQIGTAFLACAESGTNDQHREILLNGANRETVLTRTYTGRLARGLRNRLVEELEARAADLPPFPVEAWFVSQIKAAALAADRDDLTTLYSGQIAPRIKHRTAAALMEALLGEIA